MDVIKDDIRDAVEKELTAANEHFPLFASLHEAVAVIAEEYQEAAEALDSSKFLLSSAWSMVRLDNGKAALQHITRLKFVAEQMAVEACQVAAMCEKAIQSVGNCEGRKTNAENKEGST